MEITKTLSRRTLLASVGSLGFASALGMPIPYLRKLKDGIVPIAFAQEGQFKHGKDGLTLLNDRPVNMETPPHLLDNKITPANRFFIRNNGIPPVDIDPATWTLAIDGLVETPMTFTITELKKRFKTHTLQLQLECGGNGRKFYKPGASGNQWTFGAIGCAEWTGVRLKDVLVAAGVKPDVIYTAHYGADKHLSGDPKKRPIPPYEFNLLNLRPETPAPKISCVRVRSDKILSR